MGDHTVGLHRGLRKDKMSSKLKLLAHDIVYIDPADCSSSVGYKITRSEYNDDGKPHSEVELSDCSRKIQWYFNEHDGLKKIDKVLGILTKFRSEFVKARKDTRTK